MRRLILVLRAWRKRRNAREEAKGYERGRLLLRQTTAAKIVHEMEWQFGMGLERTPFDHGVLRAVAEHNVSDSGPASLPTVEEHFSNAKVQEMPVASS